MGFTVETGVSALTVFVQGLLSFFPRVCCRWCRCTWGIWPGSSRRKSDRPAAPPGHNAQYGILCDRRELCVFPSGAGFYQPWRVLSGNRAMVARIGGILIMLLGLVQLGF